MCFKKCEPWRKPASLLRRFLIPSNSLSRKIKNLFGVKLFWRFQSFLIKTKNEYLRFIFLPVGHLNFEVLLLFIFFKLPMFQIYLILSSQKCNGNYIKVENEIYTQVYSFCSKMKGPFWTTKMHLKKLKNISSQIWDFPKRFLIVALI